MNKTTLIIKYPNGTTQTVHPSPEFFKGGWSELAQAIAAPYIPAGHRVNFEVR
jgi:hypothetical protein